MGAHNTSGSEPRALVIPAPLRRHARRSQPTAGQAGGGTLGRARTKEEGVKELVRCLVDSGVEWGDIGGSARRGQAAGELRGAATHSLRPGASMATPCVTTSSGSCQSPPQRAPPASASVPASTRRQSSPQSPAKGRRCGRSKRLFGKALHGRAFFGRQLEPSPPAPWPHAPPRGCPGAPHKHERSSRGPERWPAAPRARGAGASWLPAPPRAPWRWLSRGQMRWKLSQR